MKTVLTKVPLEYQSFLKILFIILQNLTAIQHKPCRKNSLVESVFGKIAGIDFTSGALLKRSFNHGFFSEINWNFHRFFRKV